jgi:hypothetical protein
MKNTFKTMAVAAVLSTASVAAQAATWDVIDGTFFMSGITPSAIALSPGSPGQLIEGSYQSAGQIFADFIFSTLPTSTYTAQTGVDAVNHPAPSIDLGAGTADMTSFYANWNGTEFNQGGIASVTDNGNGGYLLSWSSKIVGGPFNNFTGSWTMDIKSAAPPVPVPAAVWLFGSGLVGLVGVARRKLAA